MMALRDEAGAAIGFVKILRDRTEQKEGIARLEESRERYRLVARATNDAIWDWDLATNTSLWNEALNEAYGHAPDTVEPTGECGSRRSIPRTAPASMPRSRGHRRGGTAWTEEYRFLRADGSYAHVLDRGYIIRDAEGRARRMIARCSTCPPGSSRRMRFATASVGSDSSAACWRRSSVQAPVGISIAGASTPSSLNAKAEELLGHGIGTEGDAR